MPEKTDKRGLIAWLNICVVWGTTYLAIRIGVEHMPPMLFAGLRWIIAGTGFIIYLRFTGKSFPSIKELFPIAIQGILMIGFGNGLVVVAEQWIPSGLAALLITTVPFWIVGIESIIPSGVKINKTILFGLLLGLAGVVLIFGSDFKYLFVTENLLGVLALMAADLFWVTGTIYSKYKKINVHPLMSASVQMLFAGVLQTIVGFSLGEASQFYFDKNSLLALGYLIVVGSIVGYGSYIYAIKKLPLSLVSTYAYINPVIALFLGWLVLDEKLTVQIVIAALVILAGVFVVKKGTAISTSPKVRTEPVR
jgi:drug/metabolite transporter (DMT)-like permease